MGKGIGLGVLACAVVGGALASAVVSVVQSGIQKQPPAPASTGLSYAQAAVSQSPEALTFDSHRPVDQPPDLIAERARREREHQRRLEEHLQEQVDASWSTGAAGDFRSDLGRIEQPAGFRLIDVDCRSISCVALIEFTNFQTAVHNWRQVLSLRTARNCAPEVVLPSPENEEGRYQNSVYYDCTESRRP